MLGLLLPRETPKCELVIWLPVGEVCWLRLVLLPLMLLLMTLLLLATLLLMLLPDAVPEFG